MYIHIIMYIVVLYILIHHYMDMCVYLAVHSSTNSGDVCHMFLYKPICQMITYDTV